MGTVAVRHPEQLDAQASEGRISILEPAEWREEAVRGILIRPPGSIRIVGLAHHPTGIDRVMVNGVGANLDLQPNGEVRFVGYVDVGPSDEEVEVVAYSQGSQFVRRYPLEVVPLSPGVSDLNEAWKRGEAFSGERYAVVIGISEYADPAIPRLQYADDDAQLFYDFLVSDAAGLGGFKPENVRLLKDEQADYRSIRLALRSFLQGITEQDLVVLYFAAHGTPDPLRPDDYYLLPYDTEFDNLAATGVPMSDLSETVGRLAARDVIVFADACHSGNVAGVGVRASNSNDIHRRFMEGLRSASGGSVTFTASEAGQLSQESRRWGGGHGVFTHFLVRGLRGEADEDGDLIVTLGEMLEFTRMRVQRETQNAQIPSISTTSFDRSLPMAIVLPGQRD